MLIFQTPHKGMDLNQQYLTIMYGSSCQMKNIITSFYVPIWTDLFFQEENRDDYAKDKDCLHNKIGSIA